MRRFANFASRLPARILLADLLVVGGAAAIGYGLDLVWPPAAYLVGGAAAVWTGLQFAAARGAR